MLAAAKNIHQEKTKCLSKMHFVKKKEKEKKKSNSYRVVHCGVVMKIC